MFNLHKRAKGNIGEDIACRFLASKGFHVVDRNYLKKWGEIDIIATKDTGIHFFEVKSVTFCYPVHKFNQHRPEDNVHGLKTRKIRRMIQTYIAEKNISQEREVSVHVLCVYMNMETRQARVKWMKNLVI
jgi:putative endonuclease